MSLTIASALNGSLFFIAFGSFDGGSRFPYGPNKRLPKKPVFASSAILDVSLMLLASATLSATAFLPVDSPK